MEREPDPIGVLLRSRKFLLLLLDTAVSAVLFFVGKYAVPEIAEDINVMIGLIQPVFVSLIVAIAWEDAAEKAASSFARKK